MAKAKIPAIIFQLKITLAKIRPPIWRRVEVPDCSLAILNGIIQVAMGWQGGHLWAFEVAGQQYGDDPFAEMEMKSAMSEKLSRIVANCRKFGYTYDFGDNWEHVIEVEKTLEPAPKVKYPQCVAGERACPPDDCGGPWSYADFVEAIQNPDHQEHEDLLEWVGGDFDPERFDMEAVNREFRMVR